MTNDQRNGCLLRRRESCCQWRRLEEAQRENASQWQKWLLREKRSSSLFSKRSSAALYSVTVTDPVSCLIQRSILSHVKAKLLSAQPQLLCNASVMACKPAWLAWLCSWLEAEKLQWSCAIMKIMWSGSERNVAKMKYYSNEEGNEIWK